MSEIALNLGGRPTIYDPKFCDIARSFMSQGFSVSALAGELKASRDSLYEWEKVYPEFRQALKESRMLRVKALEKGLLDGTFAGPQITARIFALKNAAPDEWRDRYEHTGADGGPISITVVRFTDEAPLTIEGELVDEAKRIESPTT